MYKEKLALTDEEIEILNFTSLVACSRGSEIWVLSTSFQKSNICWPQQPPRERVSDIGEKNFMIHS